MRDIERRLTAVEQASAQRAQQLSLSQLTEAERTALGDMWAAVLQERPPPKDGDELAAAYFAFLAGGRPQ